MATESSRDTLALVREWHEKFAVPVVDQPGIPADRAQMRLAILKEKVPELRAAFEAGDMVEVLCDIQYVLDGTFLEFGMQGMKAAAMAEVHSSNMSKRGADGRPSPGHMPNDTTISKQSTRS